MMNWPSIALVTPVFNSAKYIEQTIRSVLAQDYPNLDYFIVDGGSTDGTVDIIKKYESKISGWLSEPDHGMYDALNKGFARTSGEIMGWISATDMLHIGGLRVVGSVFQQLPEVEWITGRPTIFTQDGMTRTILNLPRWSRWRVLAGANLAIQQESTFWRRSLWEKAGGRTDASRRMAMDFELWIRFFRHAQLFTVNALIGGWRDHCDSLALTNLEDNYRIMDEVTETELQRDQGMRFVKLLRRMHRAVQPIPKVRGAWQRTVMRALYHLPGPDWPPIIECRDSKWCFRSK